MLLEAVKAELQDETYQFYVGTSYRHLLIWDQGQVLDLTAPHDHLGQKIGPFLPEDETLRRMMVRSYEILKEHPLNLARKAAGKNPPTASGSGAPAPSRCFPPLRRRRERRGP